VRRGLSWLLALPLVVAGSQLAHAVAYRVAVPDAHERAHLLADTGHAYLEYAPLVAGLGVAAIVVALALHVRTEGAARLRAWPFALLPLLTFVGQEHLEHLLQTGSASGVVAAPTFAYGVALQIPFGLIAFLVARALLRTAERIAAALRTDTRRRLRPPALRVQTFAPPFRAVLLVAGSGVRGPPPPL
jgi:hypothetical protein